jgi:hypothetical protein
MMQTHLNIMVANYNNSLELFQSDAYVTRFQAWLYYPITIYVNV